jgi:hypothetical protein
VNLLLALAGRGQSDGVALPQGAGLGRAQALRR